MNIILPYPIKQEVWILHSIKFVEKNEEILIRESKNVKEYIIKPIYKIKWIKEKKYIKSYTIDEYGIEITFSDNKWLDNDEYDSDISLYDKEINIFLSEEDADKKLQELNN